jgi:hypothetical protein
MPRRGEAFAITGIDAFRHVGAIHELPLPDGRIRLADYWGKGAGIRLQSKQGSMIMDAEQGRSKIEPDL